MTRGITDVTAYDPSFKPNREVKQELDPEAFLQLVVAQLRYQDPMNGMDQQAFMEQLATMSNMQQQYNLNSAMQVMVMRDEMSRAIALIGSTVKGSINDQPVEGKVDSVNISTGVPQLNIGALKLAFDQVTEVK